MSKIFVRYTALCLALLLCSYGFAQIPVTYLGINQGLSNNSARCILRDKRGFIWIGTLDGLNRYDGYKFRVFRNQPNDSSSLIYPLIYALGEDQAGNIWVGTRQGLSVYNIATDRFSHLRVQGDQAILKDVVRVIAADHQNNVFVGTENMGLLLCAGAGHTASRVKLITGEGSTTSYSVQSLEVSAEGKLWAFVQNRGLFVYDKPSGSLQYVDGTVKTAPALESSGNLIWIGSPNGLFEYNIADRTCVNRLSERKGQLRSGRVNALTLDKSNRLWVGTIGGGISIWDRSTGAIEHLDAGDSKYSLSAVDIHVILDDPESRKWIGTQKGGINIIDQRRSRFRAVAHDPAAPDKFKGNFVSAFYEAPDGKLWIGTDDAGVNIWNRKNNTFYNLGRETSAGARLPSNFITYICGNGPGDTWLATFDAGIIRARHDGKTIRTYKCMNPSTGLEDPVVCVLYKDRSDTLWATTLRRGNRYAALYFYNPAADRFDAFDTRLSDLFVFTEDRNAQLWGGNLSQLVKIDRKQKKHSFFELGVVVQAIYEDRSGRFWVGTGGGGLMLFDRKQGKVIARYTTDQGLSNNSVLTITEDAQGTLWICTFNGLSRFDPVTHTFRNYYHSDGLQSNQFNCNAALQLQSGELVLGGINGFNIFNPADIKPVNDTPAVVITAVKVSDILIAPGSPYAVKNEVADGVMELRIPYEKAALTFDFAALEYSLPEKISYAYYLDGWDRNWNYSGSLRTASYTHLSEGSYTFRVKSSNAEGLWNGRETIVRVMVLPPWYRSWWAYLFYTVTIGLLVIAWWRYRIKQAKLKYEIAIANFNIEKEKLEKDKQRAEYEKERAVLEGERLLNEKEKESQKKQLDFFTSITHEFRSPLTLIINPAKDLVRKMEAEGLEENRSELTAIFRNARRLLSLVDQLLFFRKADTSLDKISVVNLNFYSLCYEIYLCFVQQAKTRNIQYEFIGENPSLELYVDREKMEIVLFNLISNALKYTPDGGKIVVQLLEEPHHVLLTVSDTGAGIPGSAGEKIFEKFYKAEREAGGSMPGFGIGLYLVRQFVTAHKGAISYESEPGTGTTFRLELLTGHDHFSPEVIAQEATPQPLFLTELMDDADADITEEAGASPRVAPLEPILSDRQLLLVVDDDPAIRRYITEIFQDRFSIYEAGGGAEGLTLAEKYIPDIVISDVKMEQGDGIDFCKAIKNHPSLGHIPVILLTGTHSSELKLEGIEGGADDYIMKPFDRELLQARVTNLLKNKGNLQRFFFNEITLNQQDQKISGEYKEFLDRCIAIVENHLDDEEFSVLQLAAEMDRSYSSVYKKIKFISGQTANGFIRFIRLRKAAELFINTNHNVSEVAFQVGIYDAKFFREQFSKLFGMKPSEYIKKYRKPFQDRFTITGDGGK